MMARMSPIVMAAGVGGGPPPVGRAGVACETAVDGPGADVGLRMLPTDVGGGDEEDIRSL